MAPTTTTPARGPVDMPDPLKPIRPPARNLSKPQPRLAADAEIDTPQPQDAPQYLIADERAQPPDANGKADNDLPPIGSRTLTQIHAKLCKPFPLWAVEVKPGATTKDKTRAMAMAYVDARSYQTRLDRLAGPE